MNKNLLLSYLWRGNKGRPRNKDYAIQVKSTGKMGIRNKSTVCKEVGEENQPEKTP